MSKKCIEGKMSECCEAGVIVVTDHDGTSYYECYACNLPCDISGETEADLLRAENEKLRSERDTLKAELAELKGRNCLNCEKVMGCNSAVRLTDYDVTCTEEITYCSLWEAREP